MELMRVDSVICLAMFLASLAARPAVSQDSASSGSHPAIISVSLAEHADSIEVEVTLSKPVQADVSTLEHPDRLVFDFPGFELTHPGERLVVAASAPARQPASGYYRSPAFARPPFSSIPPGVASARHPPQHR